MGDYELKPEDGFLIKIAKDAGEIKGKCDITASRPKVVITALAHLVCKAAELIGCDVTTILCEVTYVLFGNGETDGSDSNSVGSIEQNLSDSNS